MGILRKKRSLKDNLFLGIDIGGTTIKAGVLKSSAESGFDGINPIDIISKKSIPTDTAADSSEFTRSLIDFIRGIINEHKNIRSIGAGSPGVVDSAGMVRVSPNIRGLNNLPLRKILADNFDLPVAVDNDANAAAYAELLAGSGQDKPNFIYATLGTGIGGAIIINKQIYHGDCGGAGEIGHTIIDTNSKSNSKSKSDINSNIPEQPSYRSGVLESFAGREAIISLTKSILSKYNNSILNKMDSFDVIDISEAVSESDSAAIECFGRIGQYIGTGFASAMNLLDISLVIVGGGISNAHPLLFESIIETVRDRTLPTIKANAEIRKARFSDNAGIVGAALLGKGIM